MKNHPSLDIRIATDNSHKARYRAVGFAMFVLVAGLLFARILVSLFSMAIANAVTSQTHRIIIDTLFSVLAQIGVCFFAVYIIYKIKLKYSAKQIFAYSNFNKTRWYNLALAVPIAIAGVFVTIGVSALSSMFLALLGYNRPSGGSGDGLPVEFSAGLFILQLFLVAVLPAICEEFAMRGGLFNALKGSYKGGFFYVAMALAFGLFHQNITQFFYTALFGAVMAFVVVKTKSIYPVMIIHFINNAFSVYLSHAARYNWRFFGNLFTTIANGLVTDTFLVIAIYIAIVASLGGLLFLLHYLNSAKNLKAKKDVILSSGFDHTNNRIVIVGELDNQKIKDLELEKEVYGTDSFKTKKDLVPLYKPTLADNMYFIGAIVIAGSFTLFSFIWGLLY